MWRWAPQLNAVTTFPVYISYAPLNSTSSFIFLWFPFSRIFIIPKKKKKKEKFCQVFMSDKGRPLPKFGEWDVNDPASAEGFTVIFNKARDEKKTGGGGGKPESPGKSDSVTKHGVNSAKPQSKKWFCCVQPSHAET